MTTDFTEGTDLRRGGRGAPSVWGAWVAEWLKIDEGRIGSRMAQGHVPTLTRRGKSEGRCPGAKAARLTCVVPMGPGEPNGRTVRRMVRGVGNPGREAKIES